MRNFSLSWHRVGLVALATATAAAAAATATVDRAAAAPTSGAQAMITSAAAGATAPTYKVVQEGLTPAEGARLADSLGIGNALLPTGAFAFVDNSRFGQVPTTRVGEGKDESGRPTTSEALDTKALDAIKPLSESAALARARRLLDLVDPGPEYKATPAVSHTELSISDKNGRVTQKTALDTAVTFNLTLGGLPATGQGAKLRVTYDGDGSVTQLSDTLRKLERSDDVEIIDQAAAAAGCAALYGPDVRQQAPTLGYYLPALTSEKASGDGSVKQILPAYTCNPVGGNSEQVHRLLPAVPGSSPHAKMTATRSGADVAASARADGGTPPYTYKWSSSTTALSPDASSGPSVKYAAKPREKGATEAVSLEVTDANGMSATATVELPDDGTYSGETVSGGGGFGKLAIGPDDVGIENMVEEWQCAQDSANGFKSVMASHGISSAFDWRGGNAWENDFKKASLGGHDSTYVDNVDAQWYTGHGWSGGFTFDGNHDDTQIVPSDADWGNGDLEWMQLESCQVLRDTNGFADYFTRWGPTMNGLHMLNGFHTSAYCIGGGTGADFAQYLFPQTFLWWTIRPALTVRQAWASMALDKEPSGVVYRSMGPIGPGGVTNMGDHFWGQGSVGPDISQASHTGYWAITGTV